MGDPNTRWPGLFSWAHKGARAPRPGATELALLLLAPPLLAPPLRVVLQQEHLNREPPSAPFFSSSSCAGSDHLPHSPSSLDALPVWSLPVQEASALRMLEWAADGMVIGCDAGRSIGVNHDNRLAE
jgi:hypothetical protein